LRREVSEPGKENAMNLKEEVQVAAHCQERMRVVNCPEGAECNSPAQRAGGKAEINGALTARSTMATRKDFAESVQTLKVHMPRFQR
jgi:hypothetical protein